MNAIKILEKKFVPLFKSIMEQCSARSIEYILETLDHEIVDSVVGNNEYADYIKEGATKDARIDIKYIVKERETGKVMNISDDAPDGILTTSFYVPITLHNLFIIDGKVRAPLNYLNTQDKCYRYGPHILAVNPTITLDYRDNVIKYSETSDFRDSVSVPFSELHKVPSNLLKLDDEEAKILFLQYNLEHLPKVIDSKLIEDLREPSNKDKDHITRKKIVSAYDALYIHLTRKETRRLLDRKSSTKFFKLHKFYESAVNTSIRNFFKGQSDYLVGVQNESNINPATYETLANKVILERYRNSAGNGVIHQTDYNESLALLVDPSMTPDSSNVNRINEMNKSIRYDGLETFIKVINLKTNKEDEIPLLDYLCEKILTSPHYDYNKKGIKPLKRGDTVHYKTRGDYAKGVLGQTVELKDFKYCDTHSDDRLSRSTRMIPNINFSDSVRTSMGSRMLNQAIEVVSGEEPIVGTGHKDFKDLSLIVKSKSDGVVEKFEDDSLVIKKPDGEKVSYRIPENLESSYNINVSFDVLPKVGDTIKAGQQLIKPKGISEDGSSKLGYNALVAFANYKGYTYEDGVVISESFARKMTHIYILDVEEKILDTDTIHGIIPLGTRVESPDIIAKVTRKKSASAQVRNLTNIFFPEDEQELEFDSDIKTPNNVYEGYLVDMTFSRGGQTNAKAEQVINDYNSRANRNVRLPFKYHYNKLVKPRNEIEESYSLKVIFRIVVRAEAVVGDKLSNRYGSKGVITKILPDSEMWRMEDGRLIDCILNPFAVPVRCSTL